ncbi:MAG: hypothetical protein O3C34_11180 [Proteobacteria bacterium]|nr:hypothetical protein [Pseudomonadota bacterium]
MFSIRWKRRFHTYPPLSIALFGGHYATDDWADDVPITDDEMDVLQSHFLELLPELNELEI